MDPQAPAPDASESIDWRLIGRGVLMLLLLGLCGFGLAAAPFWKQHSVDYWLWTAPCFGVFTLLLCLLTEGERQGLRRWKILQHQVLQWAGTGAAIYLVFWLIKQNFLNVEAAGPAVTILIALSVYLAGITFAWPLVLVAVLIGAMTVGAVFLERVMLVVVGLAVILIAAYVLLRSMMKRYRAAPASEPLPGPPRDIPPAIP